MPSSSASSPSLSSIIRRQSTSIICSQTQPQQNDLKLTTSNQSSLHSYNSDSSSQEVDSSSINFSSNQSTTSGPFAKLKNALNRKRSKSLISFGSSQSSFTATAASTVKTVTSNPSFNDHHQIVLGLGLMTPSSSSSSSTKSRNISISSQTPSVSLNLPTLSTSFSTPTIVSSSAASSSRSSRDNSFSSESSYGEGGYSPTISQTLFKIEENDIQKINNEDKTFEELADGILERVNVLSPASQEFKKNDVDWIIWLLAPVLVYWVSFWEIWSFNDYFPRTFSLVILVFLFIHIPSLPFPSLHFTSLHFTSFHFTFLHSPVEILDFTMTSS